MDGRSPITEYGITRITQRWFPGRFEIIPAGDHDPNLSCNCSPLVPSRSKVLMTVGPYMRRSSCANGVAGIRDKGTDSSTIKYVTICGKLCVFTKWLNC